MSCCDKQKHGEKEEVRREECVECCNRDLIAQSGALLGYAQSRLIESDQQLAISLTVQQRAIMQVTNFLYQFYACAVCIFPEEKCLFERMLRDNSSASVAISGNETAIEVVQSQVFVYFVLMLQQILCRYPCDPRVCKLMKCFLSSSLSFGRIPMASFTPVGDALLMLLFELIRVSVAFQLQDIVFCIIYKALYYFFLLQQFFSAEIVIALRNEIEQLQKMVEFKSVQFMVIPTLEKDWIQ